MRTAASGATCLESKPGEERAHRDGVGGAGVRVEEVGGKEIEKAQARVLAGLAAAGARTGRGKQAFSGVTGGQATGA